LKIEPFLEPFDKGVSEKLVKLKAVLCAGYQAQQLEMPLVVEETDAAKPRRKPRKGIIRVGAAV
jgi:hypothetical protein